MALGGVPFCVFMVLIRAMASDITRKQGELEDLNMKGI
jgi:hypothetical protein